MPTVLRQDGFEFRVRTNDHAPPHVHAFRGGGEAKIEIETGDVMRVWNMRAADVGRAENIVRENRKKLLESWREIHG